MSGRSVAAGRCRRATDGVRSDRRTVLNLGYKQGLLKADRRLQEPTPDLDGNWSRILGMTTRDEDLFCTVRAGRSEMRIAVNSRPLSPSRRV